MTGEASDSGYLFVRLPAVEDGGKADLSHALESLRNTGWRQAWSAGPSRLYLGPGSRHRIRAWGDAGVAIGDYFAMGRRASPPPPARLEGASAVGSRIVRAGWGRYVMIWEDQDGNVRVLRDPTGAIDAIGWTRRGAVFVTSEPPEALDDWLPEDAAIDWNRLKDILEAPALGSALLAISDLDPVMPGGLISLGLISAVSETVWTPADHAGPGRETEAADPEALRVIVDEAVRCLTSGHERLVGEVSGGFDSAVVATSVAATGRAGDMTWLNYRADSPESDERTYADDLAAACGIELTSILKPVRPLSMNDLLPLGGGVRPALQALDPVYDRDAALRLAGAGATGLVTGHGGDAVFFQYPTPAIAADRVARLGLRGLDPVFVVPLARWTRTSVWTVAAIGFRQRFGQRQRRALRLDPYAGRRERHPWLNGIDHLPPAKRGQISQLTNCQIFMGGCLRAQAGDLLHPLLAQPVVEHCLAIPADIATAGGRDRALARDAFADRLPASIRVRPGKGEMSTFYGLTVAASLPLFRDLLSHGRLVDQGVITPAGIEALLDPDQLIWTGDYNVVLIAAALEIWVRSWERRLSQRSHRPPNGI